MEIIIIGVLLVALMVYVSTKIKKNAAKEFEPEAVEKEDFSLEKPAGFLYPLHDEPEFAFEAYSKDYGERGTRNIWRAKVRLRIFDDTTLKKHVDRIKSGAESIDSRKQFDDLPEGQKGMILRTNRTEDEIDYKVLRKLVEVVPENKIYELKTTMLAPFAEVYTDRICEMMRSFVVK